MKRTMIDERFGIMGMEGEEVIFAAKPVGFARLVATSVAMSIMLLPLTPVAWLLANFAKSKFRYWLTNRRVIISAGFIGFRVRSIPLERISDVAFSRSVCEMASGVTSLVVRDMTGEAQQAMMVCLPNASEYQRMILDEVHKVNREPIGI